MARKDQHSPADCAQANDGAGAANAKPQHRSATKPQNLFQGPLAGQVSVYSSKNLGFAKKQDNVVCLSAVKPKRMRSDGQELFFLQALIFEP
jgi:hypothetical protein